MIEYKDLDLWLGEEYTGYEDVVGVLLDVINGVLPIEQIKQEVGDFKEHNE